MAQKRRLKSTKPPEVVIPGELLDGAANLDDGDEPLPERWHEELTRELLDKAVEGARLGLHRRTVALRIGVRPELFEFWIVEGMHPQAAPMLRELSVKFSSAVELLKWNLKRVAVRAALAGNAGAALDLLKVSDPLYRAETVEADVTPPELSQAQRYALLVASLREPEGELARAMREAGRLEAAPQLGTGEGQGH